MRRRWSIGAVVVGLLVLLLWLLWRPATVPESASRGEGRPVRPRTGAGAPSSSLLGSSTPLAGARGTLSIQGRVVGPYGPVPGALVVALAPASRELLSQAPLPPGHASSCVGSRAARTLLELAAELRGKHPPLARATTDSRGNFRLEGLEAGTLTLWAESAEGLGQRVEVAAGSEEVEVRLGPGMTFSGTVLDDQGRPAAGALVTALQRDAGRFVETSTNDEGQFLLGPLPWGPYDVLVSKEGLAPASLAQSALEQGPVQVTLTTPRRLSGQVVDERGPVAGATVRVEGDVVQGAPSMTDGRGHFSLEVLCSGRYVLTASHEDRFAQNEVFLEVELDKEAVTLFLGPPSFRSSGQVTGTSGQPSVERRTERKVEDAASLEVEWVDAEERPVSQALIRASKHGSATRTATTGLDGRAVFQGLEPGSY
ncbi:MSCRAMM family protein, partial [Archangium lansingense]|uniref:MSCRAMM family protein n=1 Tax=Archangium lansingense TaxID=2995310 RepID=UPI003B80B847